MKLQEVVMTLQEVGTIFTGQCDPLFLPSYSGPDLLWKEYFFSWCSGKVHRECQNCNAFDNKVKVFCGYGLRKSPGTLEGATCLQPQGSLTTKAILTIRRHGYPDTHSFFFGCITPNALSTQHHLGGAELRMGMRSWKKTEELFLKITDFPLCFVSVSSLRRKSPQCKFQLRLRAMLSLSEILCLCYTSEGQCSINSAEEKALCG